MGQLTTISNSYQVLLSFWYIWGEMLSNHVTKIQFPFEEDMSDGFQSKGKSGVKYSKDTIPRIPMYGTVLAHIL